MQLCFISALEFINEKQINQAVHQNSRKVNLPILISIIRMHNLNIVSYFRYNNSNLFIENDFLCSLELH